MQKLIDIKDNERRLEMRHPNEKKYAMELVPKIQQYRMPEREYESADLTKDAV